MEFTKIQHPDRVINQLQDQLATIFGAGGAKWELLTKIPASAKAAKPAMFAKSIIVARTVTVKEVSVLVPVSSASFGTPGQYAYDLGYLYICVAPNVWRRVALSAW